MRISLVLAALLITQPTWAEEFLGIEKGTESEEAPKANEAAQVESSTPSQGRWWGSGGLWPASNQFEAALTVGYAFNKYLGIDTLGYYSKFKSGSTTGTMFGPEVNGVVRLANPTILTPLFGAGVGYDRWMRSYDDVLFSDAGSMTANAFVGAQISLTKYFGIQGQRKQKVYLADAPVSFEDRRTEEPKVALINSVGFVVAF